MPDRHIRSLPAWLWTAIAIAALPGLALAQTPQGVSPGSATDALLAASSCPSFSWSGTTGALGYELIVYGIGEDDRLSPVLQKELAGDARAWAPPAAQCPNADGRYAWAVRATTEDGPGRWSELLLFTTPGAPTEDEVRRALNTLRRFRQGPESDPTAVASSVPPPSVSAPAGAGSARRNTSHTELRRYPQETVGDGGEALTTPSVSAEPSPQAVTAPASFSLNLDGDLSLGGSLFKDGYPLLHNDQSPTHYNTAVGFNALPSTTPSGANGVRNTAVGHEALELNSTGFRNTATGFRALSSNLSGHRNTADGHLALFTNTTGFRNTALGNRALFANDGGNQNTAVGDRAMQLNTFGDSNTAVGNDALTANTSGFGNTAIGRNALLANGTGNHNTALGWSAGKNWTTGDDNIAIGSIVYGAVSDTGVIRIGSGNRQTKTYIEGISGAPLSGVSVVIAGDQLGVTASSKRFKRDVRELATVKDRLRELRPVSFRYKEELVGSAEGANPLEYGLIAEEVAKVFPELVVNDDGGRPYTVKYHLLTPLLLAEIQRQEQALRDRDAAVAELRDQVAELRRRLERLAKKKRFR